MQPIFDSGRHRVDKSACNNTQGQHSRHVGTINRLKAELVSAKFAELFSRVLHPLRETLLMDVLDAARADAGKEERPIYENYECASERIVD